ncbi:hypothetical protein I545_1434 [Mycobacterium kansasii 662]|uniref:Uncharacterized protein n=1 Tax=Mycobacterium kansasii 662 TaxID=1299326 RepID=X7ZPR3_MYCKA|nr:hypothetical protein I545_1434 [Mycobacterium kansasii 662]KEP42523.1 hypothetical protein MKSMC1_23250 [Mycobacterium kansasii]
MACLLEAGHASSSPRGAAVTSRVKPIGSPPRCDLARSAVVPVRSRPA